MISRGQSFKLQLLLGRILQTWENIAPFKECFYMGFLIAIITLTCNTRQWVQRILTRQTLLLCYSKGWEKENNKFL